MKTIKTLLKENNLKSPEEYFELILKHYNRGNHNKAANLFQALKREDKVFFLCYYLDPEPFKKVISFFVKELLLN